MYSFIPTRPISHIIAWLLFVMVIVVSGFLMYLLNSLDKLSVEQLQQRTNLALQLEDKKFQNILEEYTYWDSAYIKGTLKKDPDWIKRNTGDYLLNKNHFAFSISIINQNQVAYLEKNTNVKGLSVKDIKQPLMELMHLSQNSKSKPHIYSGFFLLNS